MIRARSAFAQVLLVLIVLQGQSRGRARPVYEGDSKGSTLGHAAREKPAGSRRYPTTPSRDADREAGAPCRPKLHGPEGLDFSGGTRIPFFDLLGPRGQKVLPGLATGDEGVHTAGGFRDMAGPAPW